MIRYIAPRFTRDLTAIFVAAGVEAKPEHIARHSHNGLQEEVRFLVDNQKYVCLQNNGSNAFLKRGDDQIELILPDDAPEHLGCTVHSKEDFGKLFIAFLADGDGSFIHLSEYNTDYKTNEEERRSFMFAHNDGPVVQIAWRLTPIFPEGT